MTMGEDVALPNISVDDLLKAIRDTYTDVARSPEKGYHFHTGRAAADRIGYDSRLYDALPEENIASFAGTGNPFGLGPIAHGETVVDVGSGAGFDTLIAATLVGKGGRVVGIDMTAEMLHKARRGAEKMKAANVEFQQGYADDLPLPDGFADLLISNGVLNLSTDKRKTLAEWARVLKPGGRLFIGDIVVSKPLPQAALDDIDLWTG
jgi:SAM-dependent methyltransferase